MEFDYDLVVIGGGSAGLVAASGGVSLGAKTALIEKHKLGGDCTWFGCVPSKALIKSAGVFSLIQRLDEFGIKVKGSGDYDTSSVMSHVREVIAKIAKHDDPKIFEEKGIKVLSGAPSFIDTKTIELGGKRITSKRFIICTGSHPFVPPIEGLSGIDYLTNETIFDLEKLPQSIAVLGGGPIGVEISQALSRLGVEVCIIEMLDRVLFREDEELAQVVVDTLTNEGIKIYAGKKAVRFAKEGSNIAITVEDKNKNQSVIKTEAVLVAVGRAASVAGLYLEKAGVKYSDKGIEVNAILRTTAKNIYACGDVAGPYQFSHMAEYQGVIALGNALSPFKQTVNYSAVPWCTFTEPELARVGLTEQEARQQGNDIEVYRSHYKDNERAITDSEENGFAKVVCDKKGRILGAHIVGVHAGELIHEYVLAKSAKLTIGKLSAAIHIFPTLSQIVKRTGDQSYTKLLESKWFKVLSKVLLKLLR